MDYNVVKTYITENRDSVIKNQWFPNQYWGQDGVFWDKEFHVFIEKMNVGSGTYKRVTVCKCD